MSSAVPLIRTSKLTALNADQAISNWPAISGMLQPALKYAERRIEIEHVKKAVEDELSMIIIAWDPEIGDVYLAFACESEVYPTGLKVMNLSLAGGSAVDEWRHLWPELKKLASDFGFDQIELTGRPGWGRALGLKENSRTFIEDL